MITEETDRDHWERVSLCKECNRVFLTSAGKCKCKKRTSWIVRLWRRLT